MNPCLSARPGEGEQEEIGGRPVWQRAKQAKIGAPILFLLGVSGQGPPLGPVTCWTSMIVDSRYPS
jgi:hypothetical protein